jgi:hypothetical protein
MKQSDCTPQEQWVLEQLEKGEIADLEEKFGKKEENRRLSARFLEDLLTGGFKGLGVHRHGIRVKNAVIAEPLDLKLAQIPKAVWLLGCQFKQKVSFQDAVFENLLIISKSHFDQEANFHRARVRIDFFCRDAVFNGQVDFGGADIGGQFMADGARFESEKEAIFDALKVGQDAFFQGTEFFGKADFTLADVKGSFHLVPLEVKEKEEEERTFLTIFHQAVCFDGANIGIEFRADYVRFLSENEKATFNGLKVRRNCILDEAVFLGPVEFRGAEIGGQLRANGARFVNEDATADFNILKVVLDPFFTGAIFKGAVEFCRADIGRQFSANEAKFGNAGKKANFNRIKVGDEASFDGAVFNGNIDLADARFLDLSLRNLKELVPELSLERTVVSGKLALEQFEIRTLSASSLEVKGNAVLKGVVILEKLDLIDSIIQRLSLDGVTPPRTRIMSAWKA